MNNRKAFRLTSTLGVQAALAVSLAVITAVKHRDYFTDGGDLSDLAQFTVFSGVVLFVPVFLPVLLLSLPLYAVAVASIAGSRRGRVLIAIAVLSALIVAATMAMYFLWWKSQGGFGLLELFVCMGMALAPLGMCAATVC